MTTQAGIPTGYRRNLALEVLDFNEDGTIVEVVYTADGVPQVGRLDPYVRVEGETMNAELGIETEPCSDGGMNVTDIDAGDWIRVRGVDFGASGARSFGARVASASAGGTIEVRLGGENGTLAGTCTVPSTGGPQIWSTTSCDVTGATGVTDVTLKFTGANFNVDSWQFVAMDGGMGGAGGQSSAGQGGLPGGGASGTAGGGAGGTMPSSGGASSGGVSGGGAGAPGGTGNASGAGGTGPGAGGGATSAGASGAFAASGTGAAGTTSSGGTGMAGGPVAGASGGTRPVPRVSEDAGCACRASRHRASSFHGLLALLALVGTFAGRRCPSLVWTSTSSGFRRNVGARRRSSRAR